MNKKNEKTKFILGDPRYTGRFAFMVAAIRERSATALLIVIESPEEFTIVTPDLESAVTDLISSQLDVNLRYAIPFS